ncbi:hypothetical protein [Neorhodopirellula lusitana]|nr:hypothetical protein [Neorhodopirellula lusitana]
MKRMNYFNPLCRIASIQCCLVLACFFCGVTPRAYGYTSDDPKIVAMINAGADSLEKAASGKTFYDVAPFYKGGMGEHALPAYAHFKVHHDKNARVVKRGIDSALRFVGSVAGNDPGGHVSTTVYSASVVTLLLAEVDRVKYRRELERLEKYFRSAQFRDGGYGYRGEPLGDVSQTQYAMLALWTLDNVGIMINYEGVAKTIRWLLSVQDTSGGWPYKGKVPSGNGREKQTQVRISMAYAGGSAVLIAADILRLWGGRSNDVSSAFPGLPESVALFKDGMANLSANRPQMPTEPILAAIKDCQAYVASNAKQKIEYPFYNIYTTERFESFREIALKLPPKPNVPWYNSGVDFLTSKRSGTKWNGGQLWITESTATSFAILFLGRSTQKAIEATQEGTLAGGFGLPDDTTKIVVDGTQIKGEPVAGAVTDLLDMLEEGDGDALEGKSLPEDMELPTEPKARKAMLDRLERLVRGSSSWQARRVAARLLAQSDEMRVVPSLIYALDDPDTSVRTFARDGLRFISRKFEGFGMEITRGEDQDYGELRKAQRLWRQWYLTMDPGYIFLAE